MKKHVRGILVLLCFDYINTAMNSRYKITNPTGGSPVPPAG